MNQGEVQQHYTRQKCAKKNKKTRVWGPRCAKATTTSNTTIQRFLSTHGAPAFNSSEALKRPLRLPDPSAAASQTGTSQQKSQNLPRTTQIRRLQNKPQPCAAQERLQPEKVHKRSSRSPEPRTLAKPEAPSNPETLSKGLCKHRKVNACQLSRPQGRSSPHGGSTESVRQRLLQASTALATAVVPPKGYSIIHSMHGCLMHGCGRTLHEVLSLHLASTVHGRRSHMRRRVDICERPTQKSCIIDGFAGAQAMFDRFCGSKWSILLGM